MSWYRGYAPYVPVHQRLARGKSAAAKRLKKGESLQPLMMSGTKIATTFWGKSWCTHLEKYSDYANRLPRGRTYARNGSVADLRITRGQITAMVCGSSLYDITIKIKPLADTDWKAICRDCSTSIHSLLDLMRGKLGDDAIRRMTDPKRGMFPASSEIKMRCNCPDGASLCKHLAATLYGVGNRLDAAPELLFLLRGVDQNELISQAMAAENATSAMGFDADSELAGEDLGAMFGIEMAAPAQTPIAARKSRKPTKKKVAKTAVNKKTSVEKLPKAKAKAVRKKSATKKATTKKAAKKKSTRPKQVTTQAATIKKGKLAAKPAAKDRSAPKRKVAKKRSPTKRVTTPIDTKSIMIRLN